MHGGWNARAHAKEFTFFTLAIIHDSLAACAWFDLLNEDCTHVRINLHFKAHTLEHIYYSSLLSLGDFGIEFFSWSCLSLSKWVERFCLSWKLCRCCLRREWMMQEAHRRFRTHSENSNMRAYLFRCTSTGSLSWWLLRCRRFDHFNNFLIKITILSLHIN